MKKKYRFGTHRAAHPEETFAKATQFTHRLGITRIANVTGLDRLGIPVVMVHRPNARSVTVAQGKGADLLSARVSGLMESIETWHAENPSLPITFGRESELSNHYNLAEVERLPNLKHSGYTSDTSICWTAGQDILSGDSALVPYELIHADCTLPYPTDAGSFLSTTNGLASGNEILEATVHAITEIIERDAVNLWYRSGISARARTRVDLNSIDDELCNKTIERCKRGGMKIAIWDVTTNTNIPAFFCLLLDTERNTHPGAGSGCHVTREIALQRALFEAVQVRTTYISGTRDDLTHGEYESEAIDGKISRAQSLMFHSRDANRCFSDIPTKKYDSFEEDLDYVLDQLRDIGIEQIIRIDLSKSDIAIPVVRVVIPGLEPPIDYTDCIPGQRALKVMGKTI